MDKPDIQRSDLSGIRQEIDSIDEQIVELLGARFAASEKVRLAKTSSLLAGGMPYRPGREAVILRRLVEIADGRVPVAVIERVWRTVISASILAQADVRIVTVSEVMTDARYRQAIEQIEVDAFVVRAAQQDFDQFIALAVGTDCGA